MRIPVVSVNVGLPQVIGTLHGAEVWSAIAKLPVSTGAVTLRTTNIVGDGQADLEVHGGIDKAVYTYSADHWPWWQAQKELRCVPATFGENLTLSGFDENEVRIGDRFAWGEAELEVSQPRAPCFKLSMHTGRDDVPAAMTATGRCGWYMRVLREGAASVRGELVRVGESTGSTVREAFLAAFAPRADRGALRRIHAQPALAPAWRRMIERKIAADSGV